MTSSELQIRDHLARLVRRRPLGLLLDIDGTISPIAPSPAQAGVPSRTRAVLQRLVARLDLVAAISGRAAEDAAAMVSVAGMVFVGNHGLEVWREGAARPMPEVAGVGDKVQTVLRSAQQQLRLAGLLFEDKGLTASVHYRQAGDPAAAGEQVGRVLRELTAAQGLRLTPGRMVWEIRPPVDAHKGTAVRWLAGEYRLAGALFCGDDRTDVDAFEMLRMLREQGACSTINVGVVAAETPAAVLERADLLVDGVSGVERLLETLAEMVEA